MKEIAFSRQDAKIAKVFLGGLCAFAPLRESLLKFYAFVKMQVTKDYQAPMFYAD